MSIRLNKVTREFNVGLQSVVQVLQDAGFKDIEANPNFKITEEQYSFLQQHYSKVRVPARKSRFKVEFTEDAKSNSHIIVSHHWYGFKNDFFMFLPNLKGGILIPKDHSVDKIPFYSEDDLINCAGLIDGSEIIKENLPEPQYFIPVEPLIDKIIVDNTYDNRTVDLRITPTISLPQITPIRKIDLDSINQKVRPAKKSHEERRAEREARQAEKSKKANENKVFSQQKEKATFDYKTIRDIWLRFVDIQEKLIKQRCLPISIIPESIKIDDDKLYVVIDESRNEQQINSILKGRLGIDSYDLDSGYILVDDDKWALLSEEELESISKELSKCYIELDTTPSINVTINYGKELERVDQLNAEELRQMDSILKNGTLIEGFIEDKVAFVSNFSINRADYLRFLFGEHYVSYEKKSNKNDKQRIIEHIEYKNQYIPWDVMEQYAHIGLYCKSYTISFKVNNSKAQDSLKECFDCFSSKTNTFDFFRTFKEESCPNDYVTEVNDNILAFLDEASIFCSRDDIDINVVFVYGYSNGALIKYILQEVGQYISNKGEAYSVNVEKSQIGIDFNWREQNINEIIADVEEGFPFIKINVFEGHRFKCKVHTSLVGFDELKSKLEEKYEDIIIENDNIFQKISIRLPYVDSEYYELKRASLESDLLQLVVTGMDVKFADKIEGKIRLNINYNNESRLEDLEESIKEMRKADFGILMEDKEIPFGKLLKSNYPELIFDIDAEEKNKEKILNAFESKAISTIIPILTGDLEKISRLKNTFTMATTGAQLVNSNLQRFIFNSDEASRIPDIDLLLRRDGVVYKELCKHLLNKNINGSQKDAIIKAMFADDLAVIQGPPGTGKSTAIAEMIWQLVRKGMERGNKPERILLTSETNLAVDNAISRIINNKTNLVKPVRFGGEEKLESEGLQFSIELMKRWVEEGDECLIESEADEETNVIVHNNLILKNWLTNISNRSFYRTIDDDNEIITKWRNCLEHPNKTIREIVYKRYIEHTNVIGATCSSIGDKRAGNGNFTGFTPFFRNFCEVFNLQKRKAKIEFTTVIQDESSKATPAELVLPFVYGHRAIVIGDHRQLPPMLDKEEFEDTLDYAYKIAKKDTDKEELNNLRSFVEEHFDEMEISHFQRLYENIDSSLRGTFNLQYRMHPDINKVIEQFYREDGGLYCGLTTPKDLGVNDPDLTNPASRYHGIEIPGIVDVNTHVVFVDTTSPEMMDGKSRVNYGEVETIDRLLTRFENSSSFLKYLTNFTTEEEKQIGVISFYGKQIKQLRSVANNHPSIPIRVSTVDRFQGMERNIIIVSMVRSNIIQSSKNQRPDRKRYPEFGYPRQNSLGFAQSPNRLNVALSRAKRLLIIVGNREHFSSLDIYQHLFLTIEMNENNKILMQEDI